MYATAVLDRLDSGTIVVLALVVAIALGATIWFVSRRLAHLRFEQLEKLEQLKLQNAAELERIKAESAVEIEQLKARTAVTIEKPPSEVATIGPASDSVSPPKSPTGISFPARDDLAPIPVPEAPRGLIEALWSGQCVVILGSGMNADAGLSTYSEILNRITREVLSAEDANQCLRLLAAGRLDEFIEAVTAILAPGELANRVSRAVVESPAPKMDNTYLRLAELPVSAVVSLNVDRFAARAFKSRSPQVFIPREAERCLDALSRRELFVFMLNGLADSSEAILLSHQDLKDTIARNMALRELLQRLYYSRPLLFLGVSISGVQNFVRSIDRTSPPTARHFALVEVHDSTWDPIAKLLDSQFGVELLPFTREAHADSAIGTFLRSLAVPPARTGGSLETGAATAKVRRIELRNIGPFQECALALDKEWTFILGDNGVGKSTVLRAFAACLAGAASAVVAERLLKSGETSGTIALHFANAPPYIMNIIRKSGGGVNIETPSGIPLERQGVLALGFSALRTVGSTRVRDGEARPRRPVAKDLEALTSEDQESRLEAVKDWIVRLDHLQRATGVAKADQERYAELFARVFTTFGTLTRGIDLRPAGVNPETGVIRIWTKDGPEPIPFESLSQGTLSLIGWAGALMQRLYETAPEGLDPLQAPAIVLIDEIDAHMHPAWQLTLVRRLSAIFKNTQFIATSHSPLVVGGLEPNQVHRFERGSDGTVHVTQPDYPLKGLGAAGLLTSGLFSLASHLDVETYEALDEKRLLTAKKLKEQISDEELEKLARLEEKVADVDFTNAVRDPMYKRFVEAVAKVEAADRPVLTPAPVALSAEERAKNAEIAEQIVRDLLDDAGTPAPTPGEDSPR